MARINPGVMQVDSTNFIDANEVMLGATQAQIAKTKARLAQLEKEQEAANIAKGLNPDGSVPTPPEETPLPPPEELN